MHKNGFCRSLPKFIPRAPCRGRWTPINADESMGQTSSGRRRRIGTSRIPHQMRLCIDCAQIPSNLNPQSSIINPKPFGRSPQKPFVSKVMTDPNQACRFALRLRIVGLGGTDFLTLASSTIFGPAACSFGSGFFRSVAPISDSRDSKP